MKEETVKCSVCGHLFEREVDRKEGRLVSCPAHSFGEIEQEDWTRSATGFEEQFKKSDYKYLGWQLGLQNEDYKKCYESGHMQNTTNSNFRTVRERSFSNRGSHCTYWCTECKIWWNIDMSD